MKAREAYKWLKADSLTTSYLSSVASLASWDQRTHIPQKGHAHRAEQLAVLTRLLHEQAVNPQIAEHLSTVEASELVADPRSPEATNTREWRRDYERAIRIPGALAEELARVTAQSETVWESARPRNDFLALQPYLTRIIELLREKAEALGFEQEMYDALLEDYEPGVRTAFLIDVFQELKDGLVDLLDRIRGSRVVPAAEILKRRFPIASQKKFCLKVVEALGYDLSAGRIDQSAHSLTIGIGPGDIRITTRYDQRFFSSALFGTIHEAGHAMYEQGLPVEHWGNPAGQPASTGIHESQSRLWENFVGRSRGFWRFFFAPAKTAFSTLRDVELEEFLLAVNAVSPSLIRVEADELTYNLHILLRFELELKLLHGELSVGDLPDAWNEGMERYLGIRPPNVSVGAMQDVHWPAGVIGYFPTYILGNLYAAELFSAANSALGDLSEMFSRGEFRPLLTWLNENVHARGRSLSPTRLIEEAAHEPPSLRFFLDYCLQKYSDFYDL